jgi:hypothetical protein
VDPVVVLDSDRLSVDPGGVAVLTVTVRNVSQRVESYELAIVGPAASWATVSPDRLRVFVEEEGAATVTFSPPRGVDVPSGTAPFGVLARSTVDDDASAVAEGDLDIGVVSELSSRLTPVASDGRWSGRHRFEISNWGNSDARLALSVADPDEKLAFLLEPDVLEVPVGSTSTARLRVRARRPFLRGTPVRHPFRVTTRALGPGEDAGDAPRAAPGQPYDPAVPGADGAFQQRPVLTRTTVMAGTAAVAALGALALVGLTRGGGDDDLALAAARPDPPTDFRAEPGGAEGTVLLSWTRAPDAEQYKIVFTTPAAEAPKLADGTQAQETLGDLAAGGKYCFTLASVKGELESVPTEEQCATAGTSTGDPPTATEPEGPVEVDPEVGPEGGNGNGNGTTAGTTSPDGGQAPPPASEGHAVREGELVINEDRWIAIDSRSSQVSDTLSPSVEKRDRLTEELDRPAELLSTSDYRWPGSEAAPAIYLYVATDTEEEAEELCASGVLGPNCTISRPTPLPRS